MLAEASLSLNLARQKGHTCSTTFAKHVIRSTQWRRQNGNIRFSRVSNL